MLAQWILVLALLESKIYLNCLWEADFSVATNLHMFHKWTCKWAVKTQMSFKIQNRWQTSKIQENFTQETIYTASAAHRNLIFFKSIISNTEALELELSTNQRLTIHILSSFQSIICFLISNCTWTHRLWSIAFKFCWQISHFNSISEI